MLSSRVGLENSLLKDSISLGAGYTPGRAGVGVEYSHHRDFFGDRSSDTVSGRATFVVGKAMDLPLTLGATEGDAIVFAGIGLPAKFCISAAGTAAGVVARRDPPCPHVGTGRPQVGARWRPGVSC